MIAENETALTPISIKNSGETGSFCSFMPLSAYQRR
jgi:hypothetical protein